MITALKKSCPGCIKLNNLQLLKLMSLTSSNLSILLSPTVKLTSLDLSLHTKMVSRLRGILVILCFSSRRVHLEILHNYSSQSITSGFNRTFTLRGTPRIIWIFAGLSIVKAGKDLVDMEMKVISNHNLKFTSIEFRVTLPKHHAGYGAVERIFGSIKNTVSKSVGPHQLIMDDKELLTWTHGVIEKLNNRPLILGAPLGITLTPNHVLQEFREGFGDKVNSLAPINQQISRWNVALNMFHALWEQEYTQRRFTVIWKNQRNLPQIRDIVLFKNEPI